MTRKPTQAEIARRKYRVRFVCGHESRFGISAPLRGEMVLCQACADYRHVEDVRVA